MIENYSPRGFTRYECECGCGFIQDLPDPAFRPPYSQYKWDQLGRERESWEREWWYHAHKARFDDSEMCEECWVRYNEIHSIKIHEFYKNEN